MLFLCLLVLLLSSVRYLSRGFYNIQRLSLHEVVLTKQNSFRSRSAYHSHPGIAFTQLS
jgi:hypothetical protein